MATMVAMRSFDKTPEDFRRAAEFQRRAVLILPLLIVIGLIVLAFGAF